MSLLAARNARPLRERTGRSIGWWGAVLGLLAIFHLVVAAHVGAVYLRAATPAWPPGAGDPPGVWVSLLAAGLLVVAALLVAVGDLQARRGRAGAALLLPAAAALAVLAGALRGAMTIFSDHPVTDHAFWSVRWLLGAIDVTLAWTLAAVLLVAAVHVWRGRIRPGYHAELAVVGLWAWATAAFAAGSWLVFAGVSMWWGGL